MDEIILEAFGKINLFLDVLYKRADGYHELNTIMQQIELKDTIVLRNLKKGIKIECNDKDIPLDHNNLTHRAWTEMVRETGVDRGIHIIIHKSIPLASGLAGGSADCAAVLKGLNKLWNLNLSRDQLMDIGVKIGADVPFCIMGGTAQAKGIGEILTPLNNFSNKLILLANIGIPISTAYVYKNLNLEQRDNLPNGDKMVKYIEEDNIYKVAENMANIMEKQVIKKYPLIGEIKKDMLKYGALNSLMSGSGPTVFGLFDDEEKLYRCEYELKKKVEKVFVTKTI